MTRALAVLVLLTACQGRKAEQPPLAADHPAAIPTAELKRGQDACQAYVAAICACAKTDPSLAHDCELAGALPDAMRLAIQVASSDVSRLDVLQAQDSARKTIKNCIEETARLPSRGCR